MLMDARRMAIAKALRRAAVHAAIAGLICLCLKGLVLVNTEALLGQTLFWALVWIIGRVALYWMHLMNNVQNFEMLMEIFEANRGNYMTRAGEYLHALLDHGSITEYKDEITKFGPLPLDTYNLILSVATHVSHFLGFILITASFNVLPELAILCIILAAMIVTIRQANIKENESPTNWNLYFKNRFLAFFSYAGGMFAASMIVYSVTHAASQKNEADVVSAECRSAYASRCEAS